MEVLRWGYQIPFRRAPVLSREPIPFPAYCPNSISGKALEEEVQTLLAKGAIELAPPRSPGYYSWLFVVLKASGAWRPVIDFSLLNLRVQQTSFKMETLQSVLLSVRAVDWMVSLDLKDAYLQVPMHPESRKFLRFMVGGKVYQFKILCFGLSTAPQVFTRVMAPVSAILHRTGASSTLPRRLVASGFLSGAGSPCSGDSAPALQVFRDSRQLGEVSADSDTTDGISGSHTGLNLFQGFSCPEESREASLNWRRILVLLKTASIILAGAVRSAVFDDPARTGRKAPHAVSSAHSAEALGSGRPICTGRMDSSKLSGSRLVVGSRRVTARSVSGAGVPSARFVGLCIGRGLGAHLGKEVTSDLWAPEEVELSINVKELLAIERALLWFAPQLCGSSVAIFADNSTAIAYLSNQGGTHSPLLNSIPQRILRWAESLSVVLSPQFIMGKHNVLASSLSRPNQILGSEWTLKQQVFQDLCKRWPVSIDLFATSLNHRCLIYFSPCHDQNALGTDALLQNWNGWQAYAFPPWALIPAVLKKLRSFSGVLLTIIAPYWPQRPWFPDLLDLVVDGPVALPLSRDLLRQPHFHHFYLGVSRLSLHVWRLSSDLPVPKVSPNV